MRVTGLRTSTGAFEEAWPPLAARLNRRLSRSCPDPTEREDLVQEVGCRLFRMWERVDNRPLWPLVLTIALNLQRDAYRAWQEPSVPLSAEFASDLDVEREGLARVELAIVADAIRRLSPNHRAVLLAELGLTAPASMSPAALKMSRMRARRRLSQLLEGSISGSAIVPVRWREWFLSCRSFALRKTCWVREQIDLPPYVTGAAAVVIGLSAVGFSAGGTEPRRDAVTAEVQTAEAGSSGAATGREGERSVSRNRSSSDIAIEARGHRVTSVGPADDERDRYEVPLPGGPARIEGEVDIGGNRFTLGEPVSGSCATGQEDGFGCGSPSVKPYVKARARITYGDNVVDRQVYIGVGSPDEAAMPLVDGRQ